VIVSPGQIRAARALLGWSQDELADRAGVTRRSVYTVEHESAPVAQDTLIKLLSTLTEAGITFSRGRGKVGVMAPRATAGGSYSTDD